NERTTGLLISRMHATRKTRGSHLASVYTGIDPVGWSCYRPPALRRPRYLATGAPAPAARIGTVAGAAMLLGVLLGAGGCGPIEYINQVSLKAASSVAAAKQAGADRYAPYEYTAAEAYLHKAREEAGYAEYQ